MNGLTKKRMNEIVYDILIEIKIINKNEALIIRSKINLLHYTWYLRYTTNVRNRTKFEKNCSILQYNENCW